jgi:hypothetical protein
MGIFTAIIAWYIALAGILTSRFRWEISPSTGRSIWSAATDVGTVEIENRTLHELPSCSLREFCGSYSEGGV